MSSEFGFQNVTIWAFERSSRYLLRVAVAIELVLDAELGQNILVERIVLVLQLIVVVDVHKLAPLNEHSWNNHSKAIISRCPTKLFLLNVFAN